MYNLTFDKETDGGRFYRYSVSVDDVILKIYVETWRSPEPHPNTIFVEIGKPDDFLNKPILLPQCEHLANESPPMFHTEQSF